LELVIGTLILTKQLPNPGKLLSFEIIVAKTFQITLEKISKLLISNLLFTDDARGIRYELLAYLGGKFLKLLYLEMNRLQHLSIK
jgi:hypothetical protein